MHHPRLPVLFSVLPALFALSACFSPSLPSQVACGENGSCPPGLRCEAIANICVANDQAAVADLAFTTQPADVEATLTAPAVTVELRNADGAVVPLSGGTFAVEVAANDAGVKLSGSVIASASEGVVRFDGLEFDRPGRGIRIIVHGGDLKAQSAPFNVGITRPAVTGIIVGGVVDSCATISYRLQQAQSLPVQLLVEFDPDGPEGPLPFRRATQAGSDPGKAGVDGVRGGPQAPVQTFTWNTTADAPRVDTTGLLRVTPTLDGIVGKPAEATVTVRNGPRFYPFPLGVLHLGLIRFIDANRDGTFFESALNFEQHRIDLDGLDSFPVADGQSVFDYTVGDLDGDGLLDLVAATSTGTIFARQERSPAGRLAAGVAVAAAFSQVIAADLDHDGLAEIVGVDAANGDVVILHGSRAATHPVAEVSRPWRGGGTGHVRMADLDRDGWQDLIIGRATATQKVAVVRGGPSGFAPATTDTGLKGDVLAVADVDLDGRDDLMSLEATGLHVVASTAGRMDFSNISGNVLTAGDVDGDRLPDLVVATADRVFVYQHVARRHSVEFRSPTDLGLATATTSLIIANFAYRDRMDIYAIHEAGESSSVIIYNNVSARRCEARLQGPLTSPDDSYGGGTLSDVNGDGKLDYVFTKNSFYDHSRVLASLGRGDGTFGHAGESLYEWPPGTPARDLAAADFDRDGADDLVFLSNALSEVLVLYNDPSRPGDYSALTLPLAYAESLAVADLNHDGAPDLAILDDGHLQVRLGDPLGTRAFGAAEILPEVLDAGGEQGACFSLCRTRIADFDADGNPDVLVATPEKLYVYLAERGAPGRFGAPLSMPNRSYDLEAVLDGLGDPRAEIFSRAGATPDGAGLLIAYDVNPSGSGFETVWQAPDDTVSAPFAVDLNGDGADELLLHHLDRYATLTRGAGHELVPLVPAVYSSEFSPFASADLDSDGHRDILATSNGMLATLRLDEHGLRDLGTLLTLRGTDDPGGYGNALSLGDFSGDGLDDLAVRDAASHEVTLLRQSTQAPGELEPAEVTLGGYTRSGLEDLDGDRRADLITYTQNGSLFYRDPAAGGAAAECVADWYGSPFAVGDVDNDGRIDVVESSFGEVLFLASPADVCAAPVPVMSLDRPGAPYWHPRALKLADLNQDGFLDVVVATDAIRVALQNHDAPGTFAVTDYETKIRSDHAPYYDLELADLNADRILDIVVVDDGNAIRILYGDSPGTFLPSVVVPDDRQRNWAASLSVGDVNDDGVLDIVVGRAFANDVFLQSRAGVPSGSPGTFAYTYSVAGTHADVFDADGTTLTDFDGDGRNDLVYVDAAQGTMLLRGR